VKNLSTRVTTITTSAGVHIASDPNSGLPIRGTPPAAYWMPTLTSARPIIRTINPVTSGGRANRSLPMKVPIRIWNNPPITTPVIKPASPAVLMPATAGIITGR
jgi:hypothetical protein